MPLIVGMQKYVLHMDGYNVLVVQIDLPMILNIMLKPQAKNYLQHENLKRL